MSSRQRWRSGFLPFASAPVPGSRARGRTPTDRITPEPALKFPGRTMFASRWLSSQASVQPASWHKSSRDKRSGARIRIGERIAPGRRSSSCWVALCAPNLVRSWRADGKGETHGEKAEETETEDSEPCSCRLSHRDAVSRLRRGGARDRLLQ